MEDKILNFKGQEILASDLYTILDHILNDQKEIFEVLNANGYAPRTNPFKVGDNE